MGFKTINGKKVFIDDNRRRASSNGRNDESNGMIIGSGTRVPNSIASDIADPSESWKEKDFQQTEIGLARGEPNSDFDRKNFEGEVTDTVTTEEINKWNNLTFKERGDVLNEALGVSREDVSFYEITIGIRGFSKNEREKVIDAVNEISPEQHEWDLLDSLEEEIQIHGLSDFFTDDFLKRLPEEDQDFIEGAEDSNTPQTETIKRIKQMKFKLLGKTRNESNPLREDVFRIKIEGFD